MTRAAALAEVLDATSSLAIVCHDNPDPDCLASALALEEIATARGVAETAIVYGGEISHQQNRAFVNLLAIDALEADDVDLDVYESVALVDHSKPGANSVVPASIDLAIVVDHHPGETVDADVLDVRTAYGATATIFVEHLHEFDIDLTARLASALLFALHRERLDFVRDPTEREYESALAMYPHADLDLLEELYGTAFTPSTLDAIGRAITSRDRRGSSLVSTVGRTVETDALPQAADYLLNLEGVDTVLVYGLVNGAIRLSARSTDSRVNTGDVLADAYGELGTVGGHHDMAGGHLSLGLFADEAGDDEELLTFVGRRIERRFFDALNLDGGDESSG